MTDDELALVMLWNSQQHHLASAKDAEADTRRKVASDVFKGAKKGTLPLTEGWSISLEVPENFSIDKDKFSEMMDVASAEQVSEILKFIRMVPDIKPGAFKKAPEDIKRLFSEIVTVKDGMPKLTLKPPKA